MAQQAKVPEPSRPSVPPTTATATKVGAAAAAQPANPPTATSTDMHGHTGRKRWLWVVGGIFVLVGLITGLPWVLNALNTVSTDDAYVNGHVTFVAPRVPGQVARVLVDDNNRVRKGDLLVQIDKEPFQIQVDLAQAAVAVAQVNLVVAEAQSRSLEAQMRGARFRLDHAIENVKNQIAFLKSKVVALSALKATLAKAQSDYDRAFQVQKGAVSLEEIDRRKESLAVAGARLEEALQDVYGLRVALGLPPQPPNGDDLTQVPPDLDQTFSSVREAQSGLSQWAAQLGLTDVLTKSPKQMVEDFHKRDPEGNIDRIYAQILKDAPAIKQVAATLAQARHSLNLAQLNLRYCDVIAEIDGVVTRRSVNPGNNVVSGQGLMAIRSLREIWIDANFKETQLAALRIGQPVDLDVDMYGSRQRFKGRISGFTMGTGSTLALLPPENATGNFVKVVQRLPVRIELTDYNPDKTPLFIGSSVTPSVHLNEAPTGPDAGKMLQGYQPATAPTTAPETHP